jgi:hypothetical protein
MKLIFRRPYKSIRSLDPLELPNFVVLTGVNGAGKSHLLEALETGAVSVDGIDPNQQHGRKPTRRFDSNTLVTQDTGTFSGATLSNELAGYWDSFGQHRRNSHDAFFAALRDLPIPRLTDMSPRELVELRESELINMGCTPDVAANAINRIKRHAENLNQNVIQQFVGQDSNNRRKLIEKWAGSSSASFFTMTQDEFYETYPDNWQQIDLFQQSFARLFSSYQMNWRNNKLKEVGNIEGANVKALSEKEFLDKYGTPPWDYLNEILAVSNLDFRVNEPFQWEDAPTSQYLLTISATFRSSSPIFRLANES